MCSEFFYLRFICFLTNNILSSGLSCIELLTLIKLTPLYYKPGSLFYLYVLKYSVY